MYTNNHYILVVENTYTKQAASLDVYNVSDNPMMYRFDNVVLPSEMPSGTFNWYLIYDILDYEIEFSNDILDSIITVNPELDPELDEPVSIPMKHLISEYGILEYIKGETTAYEFMNTKQNYHSL